MYWLKFKLPLISKTWALAAVVACAVSLIVLAWWQSLASGDNDIAVVTITEKREAQESSEAIEESDPTLETNEQVENKNDEPFDSVAEETVIQKADSPSEQITVQRGGVQNSKTPDEQTEKVISSNVPTADYTQPQSPQAELSQPTALQTETQTSNTNDVETADVIENTPSRYYPCLDQDEIGLLPTISVDGKRPFDVYRTSVDADEENSLDATLTIVVTDLGIDQRLFETVIKELPKQVACAFYALKPLTDQLNTTARELGYETLLMLPMEPMAYPRIDPGSNTLLTNMGTQENIARLKKNLAQITGYIGVIPHMGSRFGRVKRDFKPVLKEIATRGVAFFEPRFSKTKAGDWLPQEKRLYHKGDYDIKCGLSKADIENTLQNVEADINAGNSVVLTVQADKMSLRVLKNWLPRISEKGVSLTPLSTVLEKL